MSLHIPVLAPRSLLWLRTV